jgi:hypothetical protein
LILSLSIQLKKITISTINMEFLQIQNSNNSYLHIEMSSLVLACAMEEKRIDLCRLGRDLILMKTKAHHLGRCISRNSSSNKKKP